MSFSVRNVIDNIVKFRWLIAIIVFIVCISLKLHFSSMGEFNRLLPTVLDESKASMYNIHGKSRAIRSDEWMVHTCRYFSQKYNNYAKYSTRNSISPTNMLIDYYAPVKDITLIGKPFNLGYIFFGNERGLSWYFCMLQILLFMTAFEMFLILTKRKILTSTIGMLMVGFSPCMQWWLIPHITILFVYAMAIFSLGYYFFVAKKMWLKLLSSCLLVSAIVGFCISIFPSCQVVCGLVVFFLLIAVLARDRENIFIFKSKWFIFRFLFVFVVVSGIILEFIVTSKLDFDILLGTDYPGSRLCIGGLDRIEDMFTNLTSLFLAYKDSNYLNNCEVSSFIHFAPLFLVLYSKISKRLAQYESRSLKVGKMLVVIILVELIYMCAGFSETLSRLTLFKYVNRMNICYGWTATIFTVWCINIIWLHKNIFKFWEYILYPLLYGFIYFTIIDNETRKYCSLRWLVLEILFFVVILMFVFMQYKKTASCLIAGVMFFAGAEINPICSGISPIINHPISEFVNERAILNSDDIWLALGDSSSIMGTFIMANGARALSTTNFYPDVDMWKLLNMDEKYYKMYNRYAHCNFYLTDKSQNIELVNGDSIKININPITLKRLNVKYIITPVDYLNSFNMKYFDIKPIFKQDNFVIYELNYVQSLNIN